MLRKNDQLDSVFIAQPERQFAHLWLVVPLMGTPETTNTHQDVGQFGARQRIRVVRAIVTVNRCLAPLA